MKMVSLEVSFLVEDDVSSEAVKATMDTGLQELSQANELNGYEWYDLDIISTRHVATNDE